MSNFRPLAPLEWEENEFTDSRKDGQSVLTTIRNEISNLRYHFLEPGQV